MKGLALDYVVKLIILIAVAVVVINLVLVFYRDIKSFVNKRTSSKKITTQIIKAKDFSTNQILTYIKACWDKTGENYKNDVVCYILKGNMKNVEEKKIKTNFPLEIKFDNSKGIAIIRYEFVGHKIVLEN